MSVPIPILLSIVLSVALPVRAQEPVSAPEQPADSPLAIRPEWIRSLAEEAWRNNPEVLSAGAYVESAELRAEAVPSWADPELFAGVMGGPRGMRADEGDLILGIQQEIPVFRKPRYERQVREQEIQIQAAGLRLTRAALFRDLTQAAYRLAGADYVISQMEEDLRLLTDWIAIAEDRYAAGSGTQSEILRLQNELSRLKTQLQTERRERDHVSLHLNRLLHRPLFEQWPRLALPPIADPVSHTHDLAQSAQHQEPESRILSEQLRKEILEVDRARRQRYPDVALALEGRRYSRTGNFRQGMLTLSLTIPWANERAYGKEVVAEQFDTVAARWSLVARERLVQEEVHHLVVAIDAVRREALLIDQEILPRNRRALENALSAWNANRGSFDELFEFQRQVRQAAVELGASITRQQELLAELKYLTAPETGLPEISGKPHQHQQK